MSSGAFETLKYIDERERPAIFVTQRLHEHVNVVGHYHDYMKLDPGWWLCGAGALACEGKHSTLSETVLKDEISRLLWQIHSPASAERYEQIRIGLLNVRQSAAVAILRDDRICGHRWSHVGRAPRPPNSDSIY